MGTISGMGFAQALVHTVHSTSACAKPIPEIVPMLKLDRPVIIHRPECTSDIEVMFYGIERAALC